MGHCVIYEYSEPSEWAIVSFMNTISLKNGSCIICEYNEPSEWAFASFVSTMSLQNWAGHHL